MRIGSNVLPTKEILAHRIQNIDTSYCLGKEPMETSVHLFFKCLVVRAIWFGCQWSIRAEHLQVSTHDDILKLVLDLPLSSQHQKTLQEQCTLQLALTLESIWNLRNQAMHNGETINLIETISRLEHKVAEYMPILHHTKNLAQKEN